MVSSPGCAQAAWAPSKDAPVGSTGLGACPPLAGGPGPAHAVWGGDPPPPPQATSARVGTGFAAGQAPDPDDGPLPRTLLQGL